MNKILLIGATGFLGSKIRIHYEVNGAEVITMGRSASSDIRVDFDCINIDSLNLSRYSFDTIIHCAAINETQITKSIYDTYLINVTLTRLLTELAVKCSVHNFIYISTFHVYGMTNGNLSEVSDTNPLNDYGLTHYLSEKIVENICSQNNINYIIVRPTNIYGLPENINEFNRWSLVPFLFVKQAIEKASISLTSSGEQLRNFVSVEDVIRRFDYLGKESVVNAYGTDTLSIYEFANKVANKALEVVGKQVKVNRIISPGVSASKKSLKIVNTFETSEANKTQLDNYLTEMFLRLRK
jgi:UDP-glucose 4-epimerase